MGIQSRQFDSRVSWVWECECVAATGGGGCLGVSSCQIGSCARVDPPPPFPPGVQENRGPQLVSDFVQFGNLECVAKDF